ncbi:MAG: low molecular weight protein-tyrosine-phosphatase [Rhodothermales bacterium]
MTDRKIRIMFVCLGNICRSPLAEYLFRRHVEEAGMNAEFDVRSSGTGDWHVGQGADTRMRTKAAEYGVSLDGHRASQFDRTDLDEFDYIFAMDKNNLHDVLYLDREDEHGNKVRLFREFDPEPEDYQVPDPYHGGARGFENVYQIVDRTVEMLLARLVEEHDLTPAE